MIGVNIPAPGADGDYSAPGLGHHYGNNLQRSSKYLPTIAVIAYDSTMAGLFANMLLKYMGQNNGIVVIETVWSGNGGTVDSDI